MGATDDHARMSVLQSVLVTLFRRGCERIESGFYFVTKVVTVSVIMSASLPADIFHLQVEVTE